VKEAARMFTHILVPLDGSPLAEQVLPHVEALAKQFGSKVTLLQAASSADEAASMDALQAASLPPAVGVGTSVNPEPSVEDELQTASAYLRALAGRLHGQGLTVDYGEVEGSPAETIVEQARALGADLIAMTTHGRSGLGRMFYGSVAEAVLRHAPCPTLLVRAGDGRPPQA